VNDSASIGTWILAGSQVLGFIWVLVKLSGRSERREITPSPLIVEPSPQYALKDHGHPEYIIREDCRSEHIKSDKAETRKFEEIQRHLDHLGNKIDATLTDHNRQAEERAAKIHSRIDPISELASATSARFDDHIEDHRNGRFDNAG